MNRGPFAMVIPNGVYKNGSDIFAILDPDSGGAQTFSVALSNDGGVTTTHWGTYTGLEEETYLALTTMTVQQFKAYVDQAQVKRGRTAVGSVTAFKNNLQISSEGADFWAFVAALGLVTSNTVTALK